jgi:hypothetical protein
MARWRVCDGCNQQRDRFTVDWTVIWITVGWDHHPALYLCPTCNRQIQRHFHSVATRAITTLREAAPNWIANADTASSCKNP